ncbi:MAG: GerMN domain-containing protein [Actinomycetales bacterium]|nr:GerMN domain-containing protein [Actinomycetales bacterium]
MRPTPLGPAADDDPLALALRGALTREAERVEPGHDGLHRIRERVSDGEHGTAAPRRWLPLVAGLAVASVVVVAAGLAAGPLVGRDPDSGPVASPSRRTGQSTTTAPPALPVYYVGGQGDGAALFREFHPATSYETAVRLQEAVTQALSRPPLDPDYRLVWPAGTTAVAEQFGSFIAIDLTTTSPRGRLTARQDPRLATLAAQQLVYTATAAVAMPVIPAGSDPSSVTASPPAGSTHTQVRITVDGATPDLFGTVSLATPFVRATGDTDPRAPAQISSLVQGAAIARGRHEVSGIAANVAGNTVEWSLSRDGRAVSRGTVSPVTSAGVPPLTGAFGDWRLSLDLDVAGQYTLTVRIPDPSSGGETVTWSDDKTFVVS